MAYSVRRDRRQPTPLAVGSHLRLLQGVLVLPGGGGIVPSSAATLGDSLVMMVMVVMVVVAAVRSRLEGVGAMYSATGAPRVTPKGLGATETQLLVEGEGGRGHPRGSVSLRGWQVAAGDGVSWHGVQVVGLWLLGCSYGGHLQEAVARLTLETVGNARWEPANRQRGRGDVVIGEVIVGAGRFIGTDAQGIVAIVIAA